MSKDKVKQLEKALRLKQDEIDLLRQTIEQLNDRITYLTSVTDNSNLIKSYINK